MLYKYLESGLFTNIFGNLCTFYSHRSSEHAIIADVCLVSFAVFDRNMNENSPSEQLIVFGVNTTETDLAIRAIRRFTGTSIKRAFYPPKPYEDFFVIEPASPIHLNQCLQLHLKELLPLKYVGFIKERMLPSFEELLPDDERLFIRSMDYPDEELQTQSLLRFQGSFHPDLYVPSAKIKRVIVPPRSISINHQLSWSSSIQRKMEYLGSSVTERWSNLSIDIQRMLLCCTIFYFFSLSLISFLGSLI